MKTIIFNILCIFLFIQTTLNTEQAHAVSDKLFTVVIDAGHGGNDPGAVGRRGKEKNINLSVALKLGKLIENNCADTRVIYTRKSDKFVPLHQRASIANNAKADLFISIHTNSLAKPNKKINGTETYTLGLHRTEDNLEVAKKENAVILIEDDYKQRYAGFNPNSSESYIIFEFLQDKYMKQSVGFAKTIQQKFRNTAKRTDRGVHQAGFLVLRETSMPSVLIELGYITNPTEEAYLLSEKGTSALANSIYQAFREYKSPTQSRQTSAKPSGTDIASETHAAETATDVPSDTQNEKPVFKIQILTSDKKLSQSSKYFKGLKPIGYYQEKGLYKYTYGESTNYNQILQLLRNKVKTKFKDAFIIAFKNDKKIDVNKAIKEFKKN